MHLRLFLLLTLVSCLKLSAGAASITADTVRLRQHLRALVTTPEPRNYLHLASLDQAASYIEKELTAAGARLSDQPYEVGGQIYRNVIGSFGPAGGPRLIVGAHYDVCGEQPGADDNGSGVAALLELARLLGQQPTLMYRVDLVAYTLEEPPFFRTKNMGSYVHAKSLHDQGIPVRGMVALETLGYYDDRKNTQDYPVDLLRLVYGGRGNYLTVAQKFGNGSFGRQFARRCRSEAALPVKHFKAPAWLPGLDFSNHLNYWQFGYSAVLVMDTAFYRNKHYHEPTDTLDRLDLRRLGLAVDAVLAALLKA